MYVNEEQKSIIKNIDIVDYAIARGIKLSETTKGKAYKIIEESLGGFYLYKNSNGFYKFSTNEKGNIIDFVKLYDDCSYLEACEKLLKYAGNNQIENHKSFVSPQNNLTKQDLEMPVSDNDYNDAIDYLVNERKIDKQIVLKLINDKHIKQFTIHNNKYVGFIGKDEKGKEKYLSLRSIKPTFENKYDKYDYKNSDKTYAFKVDYTKNSKFDIYLFEAPIDLISFINLQVISQKPLENKLFLCAGGLNNKSINKAIEHYGANINKVNICFDNDEAGNTYTEILLKELANKNIITMRIKPTHKDFNEDLVNYKANLNVLCEST